MQHHQWWLIHCSVLCPADSPTASEQQLLEDFRAKRRECVVEKDLLHSFLLPSASWEHPLGHSEGSQPLHCSAAELHTWLGAVACCADTEGSPGDYVSAFAPPSPIPCVITEPGPSGLEWCTQDLSATYWKGLGRLYSRYITCE